MADLWDALLTAFELLIRLDDALVEIVALSLTVSVSAVAIATIAGLPLGAVIAVHRFPGRGALTILLSALMGLPPVVLGLVVYLMLSRSGPFGVFGLLFTPTAMIVAQTLLVLPIVASLSRQVADELWSEYREQLASLGVGTSRAVMTVLWDARYGLLTVVLAGFGRATAEVGAVMIVGGNIDHVTRVMTTAIAMETSKGDLGLALGLGIILVGISVAVSTLTFTLGAATRPVSAPQ
jgi:tungstate transport system permease protein